MNFFLSAGFGGLCAVIAAGVAFAAASQAGRDRRRAEEIARTWDRYTWLIQHRHDVHTELIVGLLERITSTAERLVDGDLVAFSLRFTEDILASVDRSEQESSTSASRTPDTGDDDESW